MKIQLESWRVVHLSIDVLEESRAAGNDNAFSLKTGQSFPTDEKNVFYVVFDSTIADADFDLSLKAVFVFRTDAEINEEFKVSDFPKINAPAIAFPYLRAYISNITLQSGYDPIILPSINFVQMAGKSE